MYHPRSAHSSIAAHTHASANPSAVGHTVTRQTTLAYDSDNEEEQIIYDVPPQLDAGDDATREPPQTMLPNRPQITRPSDTRRRVGRPVRSKGEGAGGEGAIRSITASTSVSAPPGHEQMLNSRGNALNGRPQRPTDSVRRRPSLRTTYPSAHESIPSPSLTGQEYYHSSPLEPETSRLSNPSDLDGVGAVTARSVSGLGTARGKAYGSMLVDSDEDDNSETQDEYGEYHDEFEDVGQDAGPEPQAEEADVGSYMTAGAMTQERTRHYPEEEGDEEEDEFVVRVEDGGEDDESIASDEVPNEVAVVHRAHLNSALRPSYRPLVSATRSRSNSATSRSHDSNSAAVCSSNEVPELPTVLNTDEYGRAIVLPVHHKHSLNPPPPAVVALTADAPEQVDEKLPECDPNQICTNPFSSVDEDSPTMLPSTGVEQEKLILSERELRSTSPITVAKGTGIFQSSHGEAKPLVSTNDITVASQDLTQTHEPQGLRETPASADTMIAASKALTVVQPETILEPLTGQYMESLVATRQVGRITQQQLVPTTASAMPDKHDSPELERRDSMPAGTEYHYSQSAFESDAPSGETEYADDFEILEETTMGPDGQPIITRRRSVVSRRASLATITPPEQTPDQVKRHSVTTIPAVIKVRSKEPSKIPEIPTQQQAIISPHARRTPAQEKTGTDESSMHLKFAPETATVPTVASQEASDALTEQQLQQQHRHHDYTAAKSLLSTRPRRQRTAEAMMDQEISKLLADPSRFVQEVEAYRNKASVSGSIDYEEEETHRFHELLLIARSRIVDLESDCWNKFLSDRKALFDQSAQAAASASQPIMTDTSNQRRKGVPPRSPYVPLFPVAADEESDPVDNASVLFVDRNLPTSGPSEERRWDLEWELYSQLAQEARVLRKVLEHEPGLRATMETRANISEAHGLQIAQESVMPLNPSSQPEDGAPNGSSVFFTEVTISEPAISQPLHHLDLKGDVEALNRALTRVQKRLLTWEDNLESLRSNNQTVWSAEFYRSLVAEAKQVISEVRLGVALACVHYHGLPHESLCRQDYPHRSHYARLALESLLASSSGGHDSVNAPLTMGITAIKVLLAAASVLGDLSEMRYETLYALHLVAGSLSQCNGEDTSPPQQFSAPSSQFVSATNSADRKRIIAALLGVLIIYLRVLLSESQSERRLRLKAQEVADELQDHLTSAKALRRLSDIELELHQALRARRAHQLSEAIPIVYWMWCLSRSQLGIDIISRTKRSCAIALARLNSAVKEFQDRLVIAKRNVESVHLSGSQKKLPNLVFPSVECNDWEDDIHAEGYTESSSDSESDDECEDAAEEEHDHHRDLSETLKAVRDRNLPLLRLRRYRPLPYDVRLILQSLPETLETLEAILEPCSATTIEGIREYRNAITMKQEQELQRKLRERIALQQHHAQKSSRRKSNVHEPTRSTPKPDDFMRSLRRASTISLQTIRGSASRISRKTPCFDIEQGKSVQVFNLQATRAKLAEQARELFATRNALPDNKAEGGDGEEGELVTAIRYFVLLDREQGSQREGREMHASGASDSNLESYTSDFHDVSKPLRRLTATEILTELPFDTMASEGASPSVLYHSGQQGVSSVLEDIKVRLGENLDSLLDMVRAEVSTTDANLAALHSNLRLQAEGIPPIVPNSPTPASTQSGAQSPLSRAVTPVAELQPSPRSTASARKSLGRPPTAKELKQILEKERDIIYKRRLEQARNLYRAGKLTLVAESDRSDTGGRVDPDSQKPWVEQESDRSNDTKQRLASITEAPAPRPGAIGTVALATDTALLAALRKFEQEKNHAEAIERELRERGSKRFVAGKACLDMSRVHDEAADHYQTSLRLRFPKLPGRAKQFPQLEHPTARLTESSTAAKERALMALAEYAMLDCSSPQSLGSLTERIVTSIADEINRWVENSGCTLPHDKAIPIFALTIDNGLRIKYLGKREPAFTLVPVWQRVVRHNSLSQFLSSEGLSDENVSSEVVSPVESPALSAPMETALRRNSLGMLDMRSPILPGSQLQGQLAPREGATPLSDDFTITYKEVLLPMEQWGVTEDIKKKCTSFVRLSLKKLGDRDLPTPYPLFEIGIAQRILSTAMLQLKVNELEAKLTQQPLHASVASDTCRCSIAEHVFGKASVRCRPDSHSNLLSQFTFTIVHATNPKAPRMEIEAPIQPAQGVDMDSSQTRAAISQRHQQPHPPQTPLMTAKPSGSVPSTPARISSTQSQQLALSPQQLPTQSQQQDVGTLPNQDQLHWLDKGTMRLRSKMLRTLLTLESD